MNFVRKIHFLFEKGNYCHIFISINFIQSMLCIYKLQYIINIKLIDNRLYNIFWVQNNTSILIY